MHQIKFALDIRQVLARVEARICQLDRKFTPFAYLTLIDGKLVSLTR